MKHKFLILTITLLSSITFAQTQIISMNTNDIDTKNIKEGLIDYVVYSEDSLGKIINLTTWKHETRIYDLDGEKVIESIKYMNNKRGDQLLYSLSLSQYKDLKPLYHYKKSRNGRIEAYDFHDDYIKGSDSILNNAVSNLKVDLKAPTFNWVLDNEVFSSLEYTIGKVFKINFYGPGARGVAQYYDYKVIGEEVISIGSNKNRACWKLEIDYGDENNCIWWIDKNTKQAHKMVETWGGVKRYKIKL